MFICSRQSLVFAAAQQLRRPLIALSVLLAMAGGAGAQELRLLMIEQAGCYYCRIFNRDIAPVYEASQEGQIAPLIHAQLRGPLPEGITLSSTPFVTPTFILIGADGVEIERLTGFPGEDFFWPYIGDMIATAQGDARQDAGQ